tara:strand:- start:99 stop:284 length:186 start_codon:yes stop_codon:yes gene_type:complete
MTLIEHLEKEIKFVKKQIKKGKEPNRNNMDGYVMHGLEKKLNVLETCLSKLTEGSYMYSQK